jgi:pimeloyl-ACP methyl ester carboxylesterase
MILPLVLSLVLDAGQVAQGQLVLKECSLDGVAAPVLCGTFDVAERRERPRRRIALNIAVLKATGSAPKPDPIVPLQGGPGQGAVGLAPFYARAFAQLREERDIVLIDVRGTGRSNPLNCEIDDPATLRSPDLLPRDAIKRCRSALASGADLTAYTTETITRDLDEVRTAMGIRQWNLYGTSYGTRLAQEVIRTFGAHVRTATLKGIAAPSLAIPLSYARDAQDVLNSSVPQDVHAALNDVLAKLRRQPRIIRVGDADIAVSAGLFAESIRNQLYNPATVDAIASMIRRAAADDFVPAATAVLRLKRSFSNEIALGLFLSVTCAEDIPRIDPELVLSSVRGTFLGDFRIQQQTEACRVWATLSPGAPRPQIKPVVSDVPVLLFSGDVDPVTPKRFGDQVVQGLRNGRHIVLMGNGHAMGNSTPCITSLMKRLLETANVQQLDAACAGGAR